MKRARRERHLIKLYIADHPERAGFATRDLPQVFPRFPGGSTCATRNEQARGGSEQHSTKQGHDFWDKAAHDSGVMRPGGLGRSF